MDNSVLNQIRVPSYTLSIYKSQEGFAFFVKFLTMFPDKTADAAADFVFQAEMGAIRFG